MIVSNSIHSAPSPDITYSPAPTHALASTFPPRKRKLICRTETFMEITTTSTETEPHIEYKAAFENEYVGFGGKAFCLHFEGCVCVCARAHMHVCLYITNET